MNIGYGLRAAVLSFGVFFLLHGLLALVVSTLALRLNPYLERSNPRTAERLLFTLRLLPAVLALSFTLAVVTPAYFRWERQLGVEPVGILITIAALMGALCWMQAVLRSVGALLEARRTRQLLETDELVLAVAGVWSPRIIVSRGFLNSIPAEHRAIAIRHEMAHFRAADNLKRLLLLLTPPVTPIKTDGVYSRVDATWSHYTERAADDDAVNGDPEQATMLAELLLRIARRHEATRPAALACAIVGSTSGLRSRVEHLISIDERVQRGRTWPSVTLPAVLLLSPVLAAFSVGASKPVFEFIERLLLHAWLLHA